MVKITLDFFLIIKTTKKYLRNQIPVVDQQKLSKTHLLIQVNFQIQSLDTEKLVLVHYQLGV